LPCRERAGSPARLKDLAGAAVGNHGGVSTGPKTEAGRKRIAEGTRKY
jgi:hypothetical protein